MQSSEFTMKRKIKIVSLLVFISLILAVVVGELYLKFFNPQRYIYPAYSYSEKYRKLPHKNVVIEHSSGREKRHYTTNEHHFRGSILPVSNAYDKPNIVILGDSYTFGVGVNDGEEWAAVLAEELKDEYNVINLGVGGWGLTQQIRAYYEFGQLYQPEVVLMLFSRNDPKDNIRDRCTTIENGKFKFSNFKKDGSRVYYLNKLLSKSAIQKSHLYNFIRFSMWKGIEQEQMARAMEGMNNEEEREGVITQRESLYNELINLFVEDLNEKGIDIYFTAVNAMKEGEIISRLEPFPYIIDNISRLDSLGLIDHVDIDTCFSAKDMIVSPVLHYDKEWNHKLGTELASYLTQIKTN